MKPENTKTEARKPRTENRIVWLLFALLVVFTYFFGLTMPLVGPDEPRYAQVAREMYLRGDWVTPTLGGFDWFEKPALLYWLQIVAYKLFGINEFAARFGSAVFGLGTIFSLWILGRFSATENTEKDEKGNFPSKNSVSSAAEKDFSWWLGLVAATSIGLIVFARGASFDIILTFPLTAALVGFFVFDQSRGKSGFRLYLPLAAFYFFIGIALLAKGLVGVVFPAAIVAFYYLLSRRLPPKVFLLSLIWGTILSLAVASIWYAPMYQANGWKFIDEFFIQHHFQRFTSDKYKHHQPFWFFFLVLPLMTLPWLPFFVAAIWNFFKSCIPDPKFRTANPFAAFAFAWLAVPLVFFSLSGSKLPGYVLPALPGAIVLTAMGVDAFARKSKLRERVLQVIAALVLFFVMIAAQFFAADYARHETVKDMIETIDRKGLADEKVVSLYTVSHNLEFYAAGRLIREPDGKLKRYDDFSVLVKDLENAPNKRFLVVAPLGVVPSLTDNTLGAQVELLAENGESAIVSVGR